MSDCAETLGDQTFVRVAEVWVPEENVLRLHGGMYGALSAFAESSRDVTLRKGQGLPGRAWAEQRAIVLNTLGDDVFVRSEAATAAGLTGAVAIPIYSAGNLKAILVLLCGTDPDHAGAIEIWREHDGRLVLDDGYYGNAESLAAVSRTISFGPGQGLPGGVWAARMPILMRGLGRAGAFFLRASQAREAGIETGLGIPVSLPGREGCVLTLLSSPRSPIARRFELWDARPQRVGATARAELVDGYCDREGPLWPQQNPPVAPKSIGAWNGPLGQVLGTGLPLVQAGMTGLPASYTQLIALPIYQERILAYVVAWYL